MKLRLGFVSNSSSASFIIQRQHLSNEQVDLIRSHIQVGKERGMKCVGLSDQWDITIDGDKVQGYTFMDNFDMAFFLSNIVGVADEHIELGDE